MSEKNLNSIGFLPRFFGAFGQFFKYMGDGDYAARCQAVGSGEKLAFEAKPEVITKTVEVIKEVEVQAPQLDTVNEDGALQILQLLQQEARLIDFVKENIDGYGDAEVGAAARQIHAGCGKVVSQYFTVAPVHSSPENSRVEVASDYDPKAIKLEGRVTGSGPYVGTLIHSGWKVTATNLPKVTSTEGLTILAPAEVEV